MGRAHRVSRRHAARAQGQRRQPHAVPGGPHVLQDWPYAFTAGSAAQRDALDARQHLVQRWQHRDSAAHSEELFCNSELLKRQFLDYNLVEFGTAPILSNNVIAFNTKPQPSFNKQSVTTF